MSIEALAMAGADYLQCSINLEMLEGLGTEETPAYLLAEEDLQTPVIKTSIDDLVSKSEDFAARIVGMAKAVISRLQKCNKQKECS